jgi:hypothetical protein
MDNATLEQASEMLRKQRTEPGRPMDLAIAEEVFGLRLIYGPDSKYGDYIVGKENRDRWILPRYTIDIGDAMKVVDELHRMNLEITVQSSHNFICASIAAKSGEDTISGNDYSRSVAAAVGETMAHAICHVALVAMVEFAQEKK